MRGLDEIGGKKAAGLPPVHAWEPDNCRDIDMRIDRDGTWLYMGSPIGRKRMVRLFSTILRRDGDDRYYLVTPVEKCAIAVEDVPFVATGISVDGEGCKQVLTFSTNVGDLTTVDRDHPMRFAPAGMPGVLVPYVLVRDRLEARINRAVFYDLMELAMQVGGRRYL